MLYTYLPIYLPTRMKLKPPTMFMLPRLNFQWKSKLGSLLRLR